MTALRKGSEAATWTEALNLCAQAADALTTPAGRAALSEGEP